MVSTLWPGHSEPIFWSSGERSVTLIHVSGPGGHAEGKGNQMMPGLAQRVKGLAPDLVGFSQTAKHDGRYGLQTWGDHWVRFMDALNIERAQLLSNSLGEPLVLNIAASYPDRVDYLVVMGREECRFR